METTPKQMFYSLFEAGLGRCKEDEARARRAYFELLSSSPKRLILVRSALSEDTEMARYAVDLYPDQAEAYFWLGDALVNQEDGFVAIQAYERGLEVQDTDANVWYALGKLYQKTADDWEAAVYAYDQACFYNDSGKNGCTSAGKLYLEHGLYESAARSYRDALRVLPGYGKAMRGLVDALLALGRTEEAIPYLERLAQKGDEGALQMLEQVGVQNNE
jgi:tetratricopeptide (TPR) repeat protein